jgi:hypothetical protein
LSSYLYLFSYVRFPMDHRSEMSPVVVYVLIIETKGGDGGEDEGGGGRRLSTHYVTSHPLTNEKKKTKTTRVNINTRTPLGRVQLSLL